MDKHTGGQVMVASLKAEGVEHVFGLIGSAGMEIFDALHDERGIQFIGVRDERTGTHMADGYARASGRAGVILAGQNGPGATNLVTGLAQAQAAFSPVVAIAGSLSSAHRYRDAFQEVDQTSLFAPVTKKTWLVPQASRIGGLMSALEGCPQATDEASAIEAAGGRVRLVEGSGNNFKVTTSDDLERMRWLMERRR